MRISKEIFFMSGHSKWSQIKRSKAKLDGERGAVFTKLAREIYVAAKIGGGDPNGNFRLRTAIDKAKAALMPVDNIKRSIQRAAGEGSADNIEEIQYEGYGPGGVAVIVSAMTNNRNRTAGDIRSYFIKCDGNLGETGCVGWMFSPWGLINVTAFKGNEVDFEELFLAAADLGADDVKDMEDGEFQILTAPDMAVLEKVQKGLEDMGYSCSDAEVSQVPVNSVEITDETIAKKVIKLIDLLENHDDVQKVYSNFELKEELLSVISG
jgi:YebC/PmpR family DNA-binding regulatory protein